MRLEWIEDILAILNAGSLSNAAKQRYLTQPAFSRRIKLIEDYIGIELLDRTHKPAQLSNTVLAQQKQLEQLATGLRKLLYELRHQDRLIKDQITIVCQHSITTSVAPFLVKELTNDLDSQVQLISANRNECLSMLVTQQADLTLSYHFDDETLPIDTEFIEQIDFGTELLVPIYKTESLKELNTQYRNGELPIISYPPEVFLGIVMQREILPSLRKTLLLREKAVSSLTLAVMQLAHTGVGVAWVPHSLAIGEINDRKLTQLSHLFGSEKLKINAVRLSGEKSLMEQKAWSILSNMATLRKESFS